MGITKNVSEGCDEHGKQVQGLPIGRPDDLFGPSMIELVILLVRLTCMTATAMHRQ